jgi:hypothetical protein
MTYRSQSDEPLSGHAFPLLYNTVYCSLASSSINEAAVASIIKTAQRCNPEQGITGLLVFGSGIFFQWLEGPRDNVTQLMQNIQADPRHKSVVLLNSTEEIRERLFPDWAMERVTSADIRDVLLDALNEAKDEQNVSALRQLMTQLDSGQLRAIG